MIKVQPINPKLRFLVDRIESEIARDYTARYDRNANGILERSEYPGNTDIFERVDQNQNDRLELSEIKRYVDLLGQYRPTRDSDGTREPSEKQSFSVSPYAKLTESMRNYFSEEARDLDKNANGFIERDEFVGTPEEFALMDRDQNNLVSPSERTEGFIENNMQIQMVLQTYRFSRGTFQNRGGVIQMTV